MHLLTNTETILHHATKRHEHTCAYISLVQDDNVRPCGSTTLAGHDLQAESYQLGSKLHTLNQMRLRGLDPRASTRLLNL